LHILQIYFKYFKMFESDASPPNEPIYLFWTGGYDSTFRLCELVLIEKKKVQPIYIKSIIDNAENNKTKRKSQQQETQTMELILNKLNSNLILPLITIDTKVKISDYVAAHMKTLHEYKVVRRAICQYGALSQVSLDLNKPVEIAIENDTNHGICHSLHQYIRNNKIDYSLVPKHLKGVIIFQNFIFSVITKTKKDMLDISDKYNFRNILEITWSCWYPVKNKPCNKCIMCTSRII
jgi:hypothetical protein